jgi:hypothetical protein
MFFWLKVDYEKKNFKFFFAIQLQLYYFKYLDDFGQDIGCLIANLF